METIYGNINPDAIEEQKRYFYGSIIRLLWQRDDGYELLDQRIQTLINQISGSMKLFNNDPRVLSIIAWLEDARVNPAQFRKDVLDAANMIDRLGGGVNV